MKKKIVIKNNKELKEKEKIIKNKQIDFASNIFNLYNNGKSILDFDIENNNENDGENNEKKKRFNVVSAMNFKDKNVIGKIKHERKIKTSNPNCPKYPPAPS